MDGKTGAEELVGKVLKDPALLKTLADDARTRRTSPVADRDERRAENSHG